MKGYGYAVALGRRAAEQGRSLQSNPYKHSGSGWSNSWLRGYREARKGQKKA